MSDKPLIYGASDQVAYSRQKHIRGLPFFVSLPWRVISMLSILAAKKGRGEFTYQGNRTFGRR
jgi:hypothetical protein